MRIRSIASWILFAGIFFLIGCTGRQGEFTEESSQLEAGQVDQRSEETAIVNEPQTIEEWAAEVGAQWDNDNQAMTIQRRVPEGRTPVESFEFGSLLKLPDSELQRIKRWGIVGSQIIDPETIDFSRFTMLERFGTTSTNLTSIRGIDRAQIQAISINDAPLKDISLITNLTQARVISIRSTMLFEVPEDLSGLVAVDELDLVAPELRSMEGIKTIPNPFTMAVVGVVKDGRYQYPDVEVFRSIIGSKAQGLYMSFETEQMYGLELQQIVEEVRQYNPNFFISGFGP